MTEKLVDTISAGSSPLINIYINEAGSVIIEDAENSDNRIRIIDSMVPLLCKAITAASKKTR